MSRLEVDVPDGICGDWRIESFSVSEEESKTTAMRAAIQGDHLEFVAPGAYKRLMRGEVVVMSNTPMEVYTNRGFIWRAQGRVLINGVGLGMALQAVLLKPEVKHVTVVEISDEVIKLVSPTFSEDPRVHIVHADALSYRPATGERFDAVWHDIWDYITADNRPEMYRLHRKYGRRTSWQGSWARDYCERGW